METTLATPFSYQAEKRAYLVDAYTLRDSDGEAPRTGLVLVNRATASAAASDPTTFTPVDSPQAPLLTPQALIFPANGGFWLTFAIGMRLPFLADAQKAQALIIDPLLDDLAHFYHQIPVSRDGDTDSERFEKEWTRRCSELELVGETRSAIYNALRDVMRSGAHLAHVRGKSAKWVEKPLLLPPALLLAPYPHWKVAMACFPTWEVAFATARRLAAGFPRCTEKVPNPDRTARLLWPVPDAGRYLSFGGPGEWCDGVNEDTGRKFKYRLHDDAQMQVETLLVSQIPPWAPKYQLALHSADGDADVDALMDLATISETGAPEEAEWLLVRSREAENFLGAKRGWASVTSATKSMSSKVGKWRDRYRVTAELLQTARLPYTAIVVLQSHTRAPGWTEGEAMGVEKRRTGAHARTRKHDVVKEETGGLKKHLFVIPGEDKPLRQAGIGIFLGKRKIAPLRDSEDSVKQPETKKARLE